MAGQITLYKDEQRSLPLTNGLWTTTVDLGTATIPNVGSNPQPPVPCYGKNTGTTTIQNIYITPISGGGMGGSQLASDTDITSDNAGTAGTFGSDGTQVLVYTGNLEPAAPAPSTNTTSNVSNPTTQPTLSIGPSATRLHAGTYTLAYTFVGTNGETNLSPTSAITIAAGQSVQVSAISLITNATGVKFYLSYRSNDPSLFYAGSNGGAAQIELMGAKGFFEFWVRQNVKSTDTPGIKQARLQIDATDIG